MAIDTPARIAILGAGPISLEAAIYARYLGYEVDVYERGRVAENVRRWGHARMFTPWGMNRSPLGLAALRAQDETWQPPEDNDLLTGREFAERYLVPLAKSDLLADSMHEQAEIVAIGRDGLLKGEGLDDERRIDSDFRILWRSTMPGDHGREHIATADAVIDARGTYGNHNWLGIGGIPALGELADQAHIEYGLPDILGTQRRNYASRNVLLVGANHLAAMNLVALAELASQAPDTWITWLTHARGGEPGAPPMQGVAGDRFEERLRVFRAANALAADRGHVAFFAGTDVESLAWHADLERFSVRLSGRQPGEMEFDRIIANVGFRADDSSSTELDMDQDQSSLVGREPDFYVLGAKSHGRDPTFLLADGLKQIRELFAIIGDRPELDLYATMAGLY